MCLAGRAADALKRLMRAQQIPLCKGGSCIMPSSFHIWISKNNTGGLKAPFSRVKDTRQTFTQDTPTTKRININKNQLAADGRWF